MFKDQLKNLPEQPGVYLMFNDQDEVIYVGKAKVLKNRVSQYFQKNSGHQPKVHAMVGNIKRFEYIITGTELEALVLECNLIKQYMPKYNILLKDDKNYPYIKLTVQQPFPRILLARKIDRDGAKYFGPYVSATVVRETIDVVKKIFMIRSCDRALPRDVGKQRPCLNYDIKRCAAPCYGHISQQEYGQEVSSIIDFLEGNHGHIAERLEREMGEAAQALEFERAAKLRDKLSAIKQLGERQRIVSTQQGNQDVIALAQDGKTACIQIFYIRTGRVIGRDHYLIQNDQDDTAAQLLNDFIKQYYMMSTNIPKNILLQHEVAEKDLLEQWLTQKSGSKIDILVPKRGEKLELVDIVEKNAMETLKLHLLKYDVGKRKMNDLMFDLKELLGMERAPMRIEAYDISNTSGKDSVGVCVVFENGQPSKKDYRKFNIRSTATPDDYQSMKEVLYRRLSNGIEGEVGFTPLPDLILIDGGKGHIGAVREVLDFLKLTIPTFGLVKDDKHRTRGVTTATEEIAVKRTSNLFRFLTAIQDEVHRYAIQTHRAKRGKTAFASELSEIAGVGDKRKAALLKGFKSISAIKNATEEQLQSTPGIDKKTARAVYAYYHGQANAPRGDVPATEPHGTV